MRIVCAPDSFKESLSAAEAAAAMSRGVRAVVPDAEVVEIPMADGGEGFAEALASGLGADLREVDVVDALGRPARGLLAVAGEVAVVEVAQAVGLDRIAPEDRDIMRSTSTGVGHLIAAALDAGARRIVVGLGGSATNDAGLGMLNALGVRLYDAEGNDVAPIPAEFHRVTSLDTSGLDPRLGDVVVDAACDVTAPLTGPGGASAVFGPQKGATPPQVAELDALLTRIATLSGRQADAAIPGAGAAGGIGWALLAFLGASTRPGIELVAQLTGLDSAVADADLVLTGEGSVDAQTLQGKTPAGVAQVAARHGVPLVVLAGRVAPDADVLLNHGVTALLPITQGVTDLGTALREGAANLERTAATALRLFIARG